MNLSIHLPNDILGQLDAHVKASANSRSAVIREAVVLYLERHRAANWPEHLLAHMRAGVAAPREADDDAEPDFDAIRAEMNASMAARAKALHLE